MSYIEGFTSVLGIFFTVFHPLEGPKLLHQVPDGFIETDSNSLFKGSRNCSNINDFHRSSNFNPENDLSSSIIGSQESSSVSEPLKSIKAAGNSSKAGSPINDNKKNNFTQVRANDDNNTKSEAHDSNKAYDFSANKIYDSSALRFSDIQNLIIPKPELCNKILSFKAKRYRIIGYPVHIKEPYYARWSFRFNFCFVFDYDADSTYYEPVVKRLGKMFKILEEEQQILSKSCSSTLEYFDLKFIDKNDDENTSNNNNNIYNNNNLNDYANTTGISNPNEVENKEDNSNEIIADGISENESLNIDISDRNVITNYTPMNSSVSNMISTTNNEETNSMLSNSILSENKSKHAPYKRFQGKTISQGRNHNLQILGNSRDLDHNYDDMKAWLFESKLKLESNSRSMNNIDSRSVQLSSSQPQDVISIGSMIEQIQQDLNNYSECSVAINFGASVEIKLFPVMNLPDTTLFPNDVPISTVNLSKIIDIYWDPNLMAMKDYIDGVNSISKIAELSNMDFKYVVECIKNLMAYKCIIILDSFSFDNVYGTTSKISVFLENQVLADECKAYIYDNNRSFLNNLSRASMNHQKLTTNRIVEKPDTPTNIKKPFREKTKSFQAGLEISSKAQGKMKDVLSGVVRNSQNSEIMNSVGSSDTHNIEASSEKGEPFSEYDNSVFVAESNASDVILSDSFNNVGNGFHGKSEAEPEISMLSTIELFKLFIKFKQGKSVYTWYMENEVVFRQNNIDVRRFIYYGVLQGLLYRIYSYPVLSDFTSRWLSKCKVFYLVKDEKYLKYLNARISKLDTSSSAAERRSRRNSSFNNSNTQSFSNANNNIKHNNSVSSNNNNRNNTGGVNLFRHNNGSFAGSVTHISNAINNQINSFADNASVISETSNNNYSMVAGSTNGTMHMRDEKRDINTIITELQEEIDEMFEDEKSLKSYQGKFMLEPLSLEEINSRHYYLKQFHTKIFPSPGSTTGRANEQDASKRPNNNEISLKQLKGSQYIKLICPPSCDNKFYSLTSILTIKKQYLDKVKHFDLICTDFNTSKQELDKVMKSFWKYHIIQK